MPRKAEFSPEVVQAAQDAVEKVKAADELRMALTVLVPSLLNVSDELTGQIVGRSRATVVRLRKKFRDYCAGQDAQDRSWGGRRNAYMSIEEERVFVSGFLDKAAKGGILVVSEVRRALEAQVGHKVAKTTIYRMLDRYDWRKITPRPRHPKGDIKAQEGFKKTPENNGQMR